MYQIGKISCFKNDENIKALGPKFLIFVILDINFNPVRIFLIYELYYCAIPFYSNVSNFRSSSFIARTIVIIPPILTKLSSSTSYGSFLLEFRFNIQHYSEMSPKYMGHVYWKRGYSHWFSYWSYQVRLLILNVL